MTHYQEIVGCRLRQSPPYESGTQRKRSPELPLRQLRPSAPPIRSWLMCLTIERMTFLKPKALLDPLGISHYFTDD